MEAREKKFNWDILEGSVIGKPFFLSGGIQPDDAQKLKSFTDKAVADALFAVDINSKFEISPGIKDMARVQKFVHELKH